MGGTYFTVSISSLIDSILKRVINIRGKEKLLSIIFACGKWHVCEQ